MEDESSKAKKRSSRPPLVGSVGSSKSSLFTIIERNSGLECVVDTGAEVTLWVPGNRRIPSGNFGLRAANQTPIQTFGKAFIPLNFGFKHFTWSCILADVPRPLIGADFLRRHGLLVDVANRRLIETASFQSTQLNFVSATSSISRVLLSSATAKNKFQAQLHSYPELLKPEFHSSKVQHGVEHHIITSGHPIHSKVRRLSPEQFKIAKQEFDNMEKLGIVRRSCSAWASPLHMVPKSNGKWRPCGDPLPQTAFNAITVPDRYPLPKSPRFCTSPPRKGVFFKD